MNEALDLAKQCIELAERLHEELEQNKQRDSSKSMRPFITGSHAYGLPNEDSDIDLVIPPLTWNSDLNLLRTNKDGAGVIRYGKLNLIVAPTDEAFRLWQRCNEHLKSMKPVTREFAIRYIESAFNNAGISRFLDNSGE